MYKVLNDVKKEINNTNWSILLMRLSRLHPHF